jgi:hypothetical protein
MLSNISYKSLPPQPFSFPPLIFGVVSTGIIFALLICVHILLHNIHPPIPFPQHLPHPPSHWCQPSPLGRTCSAFLFLDFVGKKREKIKQKT